MKHYLVEFIGTFFLVLTIALTGNPLAISLVLIALVYWGGHLSGAHYNPAVTLALLLRKKITQQEASRYVLSQLTGSILACLVSSSFFSKPLIVSTGINTPWTSAFLAETLFTFLLASVVLHVAATKKTHGNQYFGLAIGAVVFVGATAVGNISGGAFNPAVGIGPLFTNTFIGHSLFDPSLFFLYILGPGLGAVAASLLHQYTNE